MIYKTVNILKMLNIKLEIKLTIYYTTRKLFKSAIMTILQTIKKDQEKDILIYNLFNYTENLPYSEEYLVYYQQKISEMADSLYDIISEITVLNITDP